MENGDKTAEHLEMATVPERNHILAADNINRCVYQVDCLGQGQFVKYYLMILNCRYGVVRRQTGHLVQAYSLF